MQCLASGRLGVLEFKALGAPGICVWLPLPLKTLREWELNLDQTRWSFDCQTTGIYTVSVGVPGRCAVPGGGGGGRGVRDSSLHYLLSTRSYAFRGLRCHLSDTGSDWDRGGRAHSSRD